MKKIFLTITLGLLILGVQGYAFAHTPICSCYENGDGTITCEGGFSNGASAAGVEMKVTDAGGKILIKGKMDDLSEFHFKKPAGKFKIIFFAGEGHSLEIDSEEVEEE